MIAYDAEDDPFMLCEMTVVTYDSPDHRMKFMHWAVYQLRRVDPRDLLHVTFQFLFSLNGFGTSAPLCRCMLRGRALSHFNPV